MYKGEAEAMMILISGTFLCNYNKVLTGIINKEILDCINNLYGKKREGECKNE